MSQVRMCDKCGIVFSTNSDGWGGGQITKVVRENGRLRDAMEQVDYCPVCNERTEKCCGCC